MFIDNVAGGENFQIFIGPSVLLGVSLRTVVWWTL